ncbi:unnamed protein product [Schistosoma turkestanicum]|nr:unnamed protein product [Schistosoma turkestanicum]
MTNNLVVLHVTRLPKYFGPVELRKYISQFGKVHELYMPKSKKTGNWKDNAFIRLSEEVAPLVASTLNNLLQFNKIIKCKLLTLSDLGYSVCQLVLIQALFLLINFVIRKNFICSTSLSNKNKVRHILHDEPGYSF